VNGTPATGLNNKRLISPKLSLLERKDVDDRGDQTNQSFRVNMEFGTIHGQYRQDLLNQKAETRGCLMKEGSNGHFYLLIVNCRVVVLKSFGQRVLRMGGDSNLFEMRDVKEKLLVTGRSPVGHLFVTSIEAHWLVTQFNALLLH